MDPLLDKSNWMITLTVQSLMEWIHQNYNSMHMSHLAFICEHINSKNNQITKLGMTTSFLILLDKCPIPFQRCNKKTLMVEKSKTLEAKKIYQWQRKIPHLSEWCKTHVKNSNRVDWHVNPRGGDFHYVWEDVVIDKHEQFGHGYMEWCEKHFIKDNSNIDSSIYYVINFFWVIIIIFV